MIGDQLAATLLDSSPDGLILVAGDGTITEATRSAAAIFGRPVDQLVGMKVEQLVPQEHRGAHVGYRERFAAERDGRPMGTGLQLFAEYADGTMFPVEISLSPVTVDGERFTIATVRDVSERQEARAQVALLKDRERIARDLHDMVIQRLFAAGMGLQAIAGLVEPPNLAERVAHVVDELDETIRELRSAIFQLGQPDDERTLSAQVAALIDERSRHLAFKPKLVIDGDLDGLPDLVGDQLTATLVEALSNVARHANATEATVRIVRMVDRVRLHVTDNGDGIADVPKPLGGISNMMWRAAELGGTCTVGPSNPTGTELDWHVPI